MDTLHQWSDTTGQPISLVTSCYALEQLKLLVHRSSTDDNNFFTESQRKVSDVFNYDPPIISALCFHNALVSHCLNTFLLHSDVKSKRHSDLTM